MIPQVIVISQENEPLIRELIDQLIRHDFTNLNLAQRPNDLAELISNDFKGFIIFCLPPEELAAWMPYIDHNLLSMFKIYFYDSLIEEDLNSSLFLQFDYIIAGENKNGILKQQLDFLKMNYWRKIPLLQLGIEQPQLSKLLKKILLTLEKTDINLITLDHISTRLNVSTDTIRNELKDKLNINYSQLKNSLINYYREHYPDEFV